MLKLQFLYMLNRQSNSDAPCRCDEGDSLGQLLSSVDLEELQGRIKTHFRHILAPIHQYAALIKLQEYPHAASLHFNENTSLGVYQAIEQALRTNSIRPNDMIMARKLVDLIRDAYAKGHRDLVTDNNLVQTLVNLGDNYDKSYPP